VRDDRVERKPLDRLVHLRAEVGEALDAVGPEPEGGAGIEAIDAFPVR
jgi:hypothetical protein